jgi:hypothetical protein
VARAIPSHYIALLDFVRFVLWWMYVKRSPTAGNPFRQVARGAGRFVPWPWHPPMIQAKPTIVELDMDKLEEIRIVPVSVQNLCTASSAGVAER